MFKTIVFFNEKSESKINSYFYYKNQIVNHYKFLLKQGLQLTSCSESHYLHIIQVCKIKNAFLVRQTSLLFKYDFYRFIKIHSYYQKVFLLLTLHHLYSSQVLTAYFNQVIHFSQRYFRTQIAWQNLLDVLNPSKHLD